MDEFNMMEVFCLVVPHAISNWQLYERDNDKQQTKQEVLQSKTIVFLVFCVVFIFLQAGFREFQLL